MKNKNLIIIWIFFIGLFFAACKDKNIVVKPEEPYISKPLIEIKIGSQIWSANNLDVDHFRYGDPIPEANSDVKWQNANKEGKPAWCYYQGDPSNGKIYGKLYNWYAVNSPQLLAPAGWRIPSDSEWAKFSKIGGLSLVESLLGGSRICDNLNNFENFFSSIGETGSWWSSTEESKDFAWEFSFFPYSNINPYSSIDRFIIPKGYGCSVLCLKNLIPSLTTSAVKNITTISAQCGGNVISDEGAVVIATGICWSTKQAPIIDDNKITFSSGLVSFTCDITGLTANTIYYVRAFATNSVGTNYGNELNFKTYGTISDIEGNIYHAVTIGTKVWLVENLKTTKFNDGTSIQKETGSAAWVNLASPGYCWYNNDITNKDTYGALYNWSAVNTGKLCPAGWHVPTEVEWRTLITFLGGESIAGRKLKETGTTHWEILDTGATNETGFTALPGGKRDLDGSFYNIGDFGNWWSSSGQGTSNTNSAWYWSISIDNSGMYNYKKNVGFSVRCILN